MTSDIEGVVRKWPIFESVTTELCGRLTANMSRKTWREWVSADIEYRRLCPALPIAPDSP